MDSLIEHLTTRNLAITGGIAFLVYYVVSFIYFAFIHPLSKVPGPRTWGGSRLPFLWSLVRGNLPHDLISLHRKYGQVLRIGPDEVTFSHPDAFNQICGPTGAQQFLKHPTWWRPFPGIPLSMIWSVDGDQHAYIRKCFSPGFTMRSLREQEPIVDRYVDLLVSRIRETIAPVGESGGEVDFLRWFNYMSFDVFGDLAFGESFECLERGDYHQWIANIFRHIKAMAGLASIRFYPTIEKVLVYVVPKSFRKAQQDHFQLVVDKVRRRIERDGFTRPDIMSGVMIQGHHEASGKDGKGLPLDIVNGTFSELTIAGSESTGSVLTATINTLIHNPGILATLVGEIRGTFRSEAEINFDTLRDLKYLNAVINESLRMSPPIRWLPPRQCPPGGNMVCGYWLPGGTATSITYQQIQRDPTSFHDADTFRPERWFEEATTDPTNPFHNDRRDAVRPFLYGPRTCLGQHLAWAEMRLALAKLLWNFDVAAPADESKVVVWEDLKSFMVIDKKPVWVVVKPRTDFPAGV